MGEDLQIGQLVRSTAGRDKDYLFLVVQQVNARTVLIADGNFRRVQNPKRKNARHLMPYPAVADDVQMELAKGNSIPDRQLRAALQRLVNANGQLFQREVRATYG